MDILPSPPAKRPSAPVRFATSASVAAAVAQSDPNVQQEQAIRQALTLSFVVYEPLAHVEQQLVAAQFKQVRPLNVRYSGTQGMCCIRGDTAYVVFRGSASLLDWIIDFLFIPFFWPLCHFGFGFAWRSIRGQVRGWLQALPPQVTQVVLCGHSLGGGIAHLAALELSRDYPIHSVVTFGAPKACFFGTASRYNQTKIQGDKSRPLGAVTYAVVNQRDMVAKVPFAWLGFRDVGQLIYIDQYNEVNFGDDAHRARARDSMADSDVLFGFMEEEKVASFGLREAGLGRLPFTTPAPESVQSKARRVMRWIATNIPLAKYILTPTLMYVLFCLYFLRSGVAHMGRNYTGVFQLGLGTWPYTRYKPTKGEQLRSTITRLIMGATAFGLFIWGLVAIVSLTIAGLSK